MTPQQLVKQAQRAIAKGGYVPPKTPTWHPYYWLGRLHAAEEVMKGDRVRRRNRKPKANSATR